ncbi:hypothetical protein SOASR031_35560 [Leminorella grimontii]|nr:hypothetical protein SOASR031_35560 [Leminorella grimontii]
MASPSLVVRGALSSSFWFKAGVACVCVSSTLELHPVNHSAQSAVLTSIPFFIFIFLLISFYSKTYVQ